jgi:hypothetical protein
MYGWDEIVAAFKEHMEESPEPVQPSTRYDYDVTIAGDRAWAACLQKNADGSVGKRLTLLAKRAGVWKITSLLF